MELGHAMPNPESRARGRIVLLISAPSGTGKTTVCNGLLANVKDLVSAITCTTRSPRGTERDGVDYHFLSVGEFARREKARRFLENAAVYGHRYGTLRDEVIGRLQEGSDILLNVDVQGAEGIRNEARRQPELGGALVTVFLVPPTLEALETRLRGRGTDLPRAIRERVAEAKREIRQAPKFDYVVISGTRDEDLTRVQAILTAERLRQHRVRLPDATPVGGGSHGLNERPVSFPNER